MYCLGLVFDGLIKVVMLKSLINMIVRIVNFIEIGGVFMILINFCYVFVKLIDGDFILLYFVCRIIFVFFGCMCNFGYLFCYGIMYVFYFDFSK